MFRVPSRTVSVAVVLLLVAGCAGSEPAPPRDPSAGSVFPRPPVESSAAPTEGAASPAAASSLGPGSTADDYVRAALLRNPGVEAAFQSWRAAADRGAQVGSLPDPRLTFGYFVEEIQTRTGPQEYRVGVQQSFPWPGTLGDREAAADARATAEWRRFEAAQWYTAERVLRALHDLRYLDRAIAITAENLELLRSFEVAVRARYRVGTGSHPDLIRVQVELGQLEDRLAQLRALRPATIAALNAVLDRPPGTPVERVPDIPERVATTSPDQLIEAARATSPELLALDGEIEATRLDESAARRGGYPDFSLGLDYIFTGSADAPGTRGSGDDPILVTLGLELPFGRGRIDAGVRESVARRSAAVHRRSEVENRLAHAIHRVWFEHTDADRRVRLHEEGLIPKSEESLRASLAGFRAGNTSFLDLLDTERTLLEFSIAAERARAERDTALARLRTLVGGPVPTRGPEDGESPEEEPR